VADGIRGYPEIATWLAARGPWRATVTAYDCIYHAQQQQPTGGAISMLWHPRAGPLLAGSMARYFLVEKNNMQLYPEDHPLTPRVELWEDESWFTQLYDLTARVTHTDKGGTLGFAVAARLVNDARKEPARGNADCSLVYHFDAEAVMIAVNAPGVGSATARPRLVLPVISPTGEKVTHSANRIEIEKPQGTVVIEANAPLRIEKTTRPRIFNLVPGFEAVPIIAEIPADTRLECRIRFVPKAP
jgi:hypothetical protein